MLVRVLGPVRVEAEDGTPRSLRRMERRLLAALAARRPHAVGTDAIADALWPAGPPSSARKTIQTNVLRLRDAIGHDAVETVDGAYRLADHVEVDVDRFESAVRAGAWHEALSWFTGEPFVELDSWVPAEAPRARLAELRLAAEESRLAALVDEGMHDGIAELEALISVAPLREGAWCLLVRALRDAGRRAEALRACERARQVFIAELGTTPGRELTVLYESLVDDPGDIRRRAEDALAASGDGWVTGMDAADPVVTALEDAASRVPPGPTPLRARLLARLAVIRSHHRPMAECERTASSALAIARVLDRPPVLAEALLAHIVVVEDPACRDRRRAAIDELLTLSRTQGQPAWRRWALPIVARMAGMDGDLDAAGAALDEVRGGDADLMRASVAGDWDAARRAIERIRKEDEARNFDPNAAAIRAFGTLGIISLHDGTAVAGPRPVMEWPLPSLAWAVDAWHADALARAGDRAAAGDELDAMDLDELVAVERNGYWLPLLAMLADAAHLAERPGVADALASMLEPHVGLTIFDPGMLYRGTVSHAAGLAAATCGRTSLAEQLLDDALETHQRHRSSWMAARTIEALTSVRPSAATTDETSPPLPSRSP